MKYVVKVTVIMKIHQSPKINESDGLVVKTLGNYVASYIQ